MQFPTRNCDCCGDVIPDEGPDAQSCLRCLSGNCSASVDFPINEDRAEWQRKFELQQACKDILSEIELADFALLTLEEGYGYAFTALYEHGVEDPNGYLRAKGILE